MYEIIVVISLLGIIISGVLLQIDKDKAENSLAVYMDRYEYAQRFISNNGLMDKYRESIAEDEKFWGEELFG